MKIQEPKEEYIEADILEWLAVIGGSADKIISEGFYNARKGVYQRRKSAYASTGISDIIGTLPNGRYIAIEVKKPSEMQFFDRPLEELVQREQEAIKSANLGEIKPETVKRYTHAVEQRAFLDMKIKRGGVGFFASSISECIEKLKAFGVQIK